FNVKLANSVLETQLFWIDTEMEKETRDARKTGQTFEVVDKVYDQYKLAD
ncbi:MAG: microcin C transport system substrate-binding protein, partial [Candidatus Azotimanducaceae bacterium]